MPEMRDRIDETLEWIRYGDRDLRAAEGLLALDDPILENGLFHCQQAVEKWLKSLLISNGIAFPKTHDLGKIGALCIAIEPDLRALVEAVADLTDFATVYRYPGADLVVDTSDAAQWMHLARRIRSAVLERMPAAVQEALG